MLMTRSLLNSELTYFSSLATKFALSFAHIPSKLLGLPAWHQAHPAHQYFVETLYDSPHTCMTSLFLLCQFHSP